MISLIKKLPYIRGLHQQIHQLKQELKRWQTWKPPGHFYSPIPSLEEVKSHERQIFGGADSTSITGINLNEVRQSQLLGEFSSFYNEMAFPEVATEGFRYYFKNEYFSFSDGISLYCMLRHLRPKRVVEIGSGFSSALMLDTNDRFLDRSVRFTFVEPYPERLESLIWDTDRANTNILRHPVQEIPLSVFEELQAGDILFIDSSHVCKTGSDVNFLLFEVLPVLAPGVHVHFHDIFFPFEYPMSWIYEGVAWNEAYMLRAFLQYNSSFEIEFFVSFVMRQMRNQVAAIMPIALKSEKDKISFYEDAPGGSIWLVKVGRAREVNAAAYMCIG